METEIDVTSGSAIEEEMRADEENDLEDILEIMDDDKRIGHRDLQNCANAYVAGWLAQKFVSKYNCSHCSKYFKEKENFDKKTAAIIKLRAFRSYCLTTPSNAFENDLNLIIFEFEKYFKCFKTKQNVCTQMYQIITNKIKLKSDCEKHCNITLKCIIQVLIRFTLKNFNNSLKDIKIKNEILKASVNGKLKRCRNKFKSNGIKRKYFNLQKRSIVNKYL